MLSESKINIFYFSIFYFSIICASKFSQRGTKSSHVLISPGEWSRRQKFDHNSITYYVNFKIQGSRTWVRAVLSFTSMELPRNFQMSSHPLWVSRNPGSFSNLESLCHQLYGWQPLCEGRGAVPQKVCSAQDLTRTDLLDFQNPNRKEYSIVCQFPPHLFNSKLSSHSHPSLGCIFYCLRRQGKRNNSGKSTQQSTSDIFLYLALGPVAFKIRRLRTCCLCSQVQSWQIPQVSQPSWGMVERRSKEYPGWFSSLLSHHRHQPIQNSQISDRSYLNQYIRSFQYLSNFLPHYHQ